MSKKSKRQTRKSTPAAAQTPSPSTVLEVPRSTVRSEREFNPDYSYVKKDLKRIGTLASIFIIILVVLSFVI